MTTLFVRHAVADYDAWRREYDGFGPEQTRLGVKAEAVYRSVDDPTDVTVTHEFETVAAAQAFAGSDEIRQVMGKSGVVGAPTIWFTHRT